MLDFRSTKFWAGLTLFAVLLCQSLPLSADTTGRPIKNIYALAPSEIVVEFEESSGIPNAPHILDLPGPSHRVVLDFSDASFEEGVVADPETISIAVNHVLSNVKAVHYTNISNGDKPIARLVLDLDPAASVNPSVAELALGQVTVSLANKITKLPQEEEAKKAQHNIATKAPPTADPAPATPVGFSSAASQAISTDTSTAPARAAAPSTNTSIALTNTSVPAPSTTTGGTTTAPPTSARKDESAGQQSTTTTTATATPATTTTASSNDPGERALEALKHYNTGVKLHLVGKLGDAITEYQNALALNPQLSEAHSNLGLLYNQQHNYAQALSEFRKALSINPRDAITYNGIGAALRAEKDLAGAIKNWETAVELDPHLATASYNLGTAYELQKEYDRAVKAYQQAAKSDYRLGEAYYRIALIMERQHRYQDATKQFEQALKVSANAEYSEDARQRLAYLEQNKKISKR